MASIAQRLASIGGVNAELLPGPFAGSDMQLVISCLNKTRLSVMPDADVPALYEVVHFAAAGDKIFDKLTADAVVTKVSAVAAGGERQKERGQ